MTYLILRYVHLLGLTLMGAGLIGVWYADLRSRQVRDLDLPLFGELVRQIAVFYDGLVVPGALLLLGSGTWLTITVYGGWAFLRQPWLAGMVALFAFEFIEGNTITRLYFMRLRRLTKVVARAGVSHPRARDGSPRAPTDLHALSRSADLFRHRRLGGNEAEHLDTLPGWNGPSRRRCDRPRGRDSTAISVRTCNQAMIRGSSTGSSRHLTLE